MNRLHEKTGPISSVILFLWLLAVLLAYGLSGPSVDEIVYRQPPHHFPYQATVNP